MPEITPHHRRPIPTALVSRPGVFRQSLAASLGACPWIEVVAAFGDGLTTLNQLAEFGPEIVVIDSNLLDEEVDALVVAIKAKHPLVRCLVLTSSGSREACVRARVAQMQLLLVTHLDRTCERSCLSWREFRLIDGPA